MQPIADVVSAARLGINKARVAGGQAPLARDHLPFNRKGAPFDRQAIDTIAGAAASAGRITVSLSHGADATVIAVTDNGAGIPAINHVLTTPQLGFFRQVFPDMPDRQFNHVFNRYAHIFLEEDVEPRSPQSDVALLPIAPFRGPIPSLSIVGR